MAIQPASLENFQHLVTSHLSVAGTSALWSQIENLTAELMGRPVPAPNDVLGRIHARQAVIVTPANRDDYQRVCTIFERALAKTSVPQAKLSDAHRFWKGLENHRRVIFPDQKAVTISVSEDSMLYGLAPLVSFEDLSIGKMLGVDPYVAVAILNTCNFYRQGSPLGYPFMEHFASSQALRLELTLRLELGLPGLLQSFGEEPGFEVWRQAILFLDWLADRDILRLGNINNLIFNLHGINRSLLLRILEEFQHSSGPVAEAAYLAAQAAVLKLRNDSPFLMTQWEGNPILVPFRLKVDDSGPLPGRMTAHNIAAHLLSGIPELSLNLTFQDRAPVADLSLIAERIFMTTDKENTGDIKSPVFSKLSDSFYRHVLRDIYSSKIVWVLRVALHNGKTDLVCSYLRNPKYHGIAANDLLVDAASKGDDQVVSAIMAHPNLMKYVGRVYVTEALTRAITAGHSLVRELLSGAPQLASL